MAGAKSPLKGRGSASRIEPRFNQQQRETIDDNWFSRLIRQNQCRIAYLRGGKCNHPRFGHRLPGQGEHADMLAQRFQRISRKLTLNQSLTPLRCDLFSPSPRQRSLF